MGLFSTDQCPNCLSPSVKRRTIMAMFEQLSFINNMECKRCGEKFRIEPTFLGFLFRVIVPFLMLILVIGVLF